MNKFISCFYDFIFPTFFLFFSVVLRLVPVFRFKGILGSDRLFHFYYIQFIRENKHSLPERNERVVGGSNLSSYPALYHMMLSFLPDSWDKIADKFYALLFDLIISTTIYFLCVKHFFIPPSYANFSICLSLYIIAPTLTFLYMGPRSYCLTPRNFSQFLFALTSLLLIFYNNISFILIPAAALISLNILSSMFFMQVLLFFIPVYTILSFDLKFLLSAFLSFSFLLVFFRKFTLRTSFSVFKHFRYTNQTAKHLLHYRYQFKKIIVALKKFNLKDLAYEIVFCNAYTSVFLRSLDVFLIMLVFFIEFNNKIQVEQPIFFGFYFIMCGFFAFIVTSFRYFARLGEPERYIEFVYPVLFMVFIYMTKLEIKAVFYLSFYFYIMYFFNIMYMNIVNKLGRGKEDQDLMSLLKKINLSASDTVLTLRADQKYKILLWSKAKIVASYFITGNVDLIKSGFENWFSQDCLYVNPRNLEDICRKYDVKYVIHNKKREKEIENKIGISYDFSKFSMKYRNKTYCVYSLS